MTFDEFEKNQSFENFFERFWFLKRFRWNHCAAIYHNVIPRIHHFIYRALARSFGYKTPIFHSRYSPSITPSIVDSHDYLHMRKQIHVLHCAIWMHLIFECKFTELQILRLCHLTFFDLQLWEICKTCDKYYIVLLSDLCAKHLLKRFDKQKRIFFF